ncbi:MAG: class I SAM-dependent methyltransferase [Chryseolinea sp.]
MEDPKEIVKKGYDELSARYRERFKASHENEYIRWVAEFKSLLPNHGTILELGCGDGVPVARELTRQFQYTGVDLSPVQIENARKNVTETWFIVADMTQLQYTENSYDGIIALYSIIHVPLEQQRQLLKSIYHWLKTPGYFLCTLGINEGTDTEENWIAEGTTMYWSNNSLSQYLEWLESIGFSIITNQYVSETETTGHALLLLKK